MITQNNFDAIMAVIEEFEGSFFDLDNNRQVDARGFRAAWIELARLLGKRALGPGDIVVLAIHTGPLFPAALAAILSRGATPLLLHGATPLPALVKIAQKIGASFVLRDPSASSEPDELAFAKPEVIIAGESDSHFATLLLQKIDRVEPEPAQGNVSGVILNPTSGTTGESKLAARNGFCCLEEVRHIRDAIDVGPQDRFLTCVPMNHAYGFGMGTLVPLAAKATIVTQRSFNPRTALRALSQQRISVFPAVPAMLDLMLKAGTWPDGLPRTVTSAGSPLSERTATAFYEKTNTRARPLYGTTESGTIAIGDSDEAALHGCVGKPLPGVEVCLRSMEDVGDETSQERLPEGVGVLHVRSSSMMPGYFESTSPALKTVADGWFNTGDLAKLDQSGAVHLVGRVKEVINVAGSKVIPTEVESVLAALDGVVEVAAYAGKHASGSEIVKVAVVTAREIPLSEIQAHCKNYLVGYKRPEIVTFLDALPRSPSGKILRNQLP